MADTNTARSPYTPAFYEMHRDACASSAAAMVPLLHSLVRPRSVVDVGCGDGTWLAAFRARGVEDIVGLDGDYVRRHDLRIPLEAFVPSDLAQGFHLPRKFDLALSLEVAEHVDAAAAGTFIADLTRLADVVFFSAAIPGQGGNHHVNEQWPGYWTAHFAEHSFQAVDCIRQAFWDDPRVAYYYAQNGFLYVRQGHPLMETAAARSRDMPLRVVHPDCFAAPPSLRYILHYLYPALKSAVRRRVPAQLRWLLPT